VKPPAPAAVLAATPDKNLFALDKRAFSHGCMRVQDPVKYAEPRRKPRRPRSGHVC
jgi:murein L,D-transpeptidase YcbB/YkuD